MESIEESIRSPKHLCILAVGMSSAFNRSKLVELLKGENIMNPDEVKMLEIHMENIQ